MPIRMRAVRACLSVTIVLFASVALAQRLTLNDGSTVDGTVIRNGDVYWAKLADGSTRTIQASDVASVSDSPAGGASAAGGASGAAPADSGTHGDDYMAAFYQAQAVNAPDAAVAIWQKYLQAHPTDASAQAQLANWKTLADGHAEKINGQWVGGDDLANRKAQAAQLVGEAGAAIQANQTLKSEELLEQAEKIYPNSYEVNFLLGYMSMLQRKLPQASSYLSIAVKLRPDAPEALCDLGVAEAVQLHWIPALTSLRKSVEAADSEANTQDLVNALAHCPIDIRRDSIEGQKAQSAADLLAPKYHIEGANQRFTLMGLQEHAQRRGDGPGGQMEGPQWSGSGFFINDHGLILTNRHVAKDAARLLVLIGDSGKRAAAHVVAISTDQDLALIQVDGADATPFLKLSAGDVPPDGADCTVMGYPMIDELGASVKVTRGIVSSASKIAGANVMIDAKVNPGNSGGPILDSSGNVMAIVCMKSLSSSTEDSYGLGISAGQIRKFLAETHIDAKPGGDAATPYTTQQIAAEAQPATVCIMARRN